MSNHHLSDPAENPQGEYIEAAFHALRVDRPDVAMGYLIEGLGSHTYSEILIREKAGESNGA